MMLAHPLFSEPLIFTEDAVNVILIENPPAFYSFVSELMSQIKGDEGNTVLSQDYTPIDLKTGMELVTDIFNIDMNQKRIIARMHSILSANATGSEMYVRTMETLGMLSVYLEELSKTVDFPVSCSDSLNVASLLKFAEVKPELECCGAAEKVADYIKLMQEFFSPLCFAFVNLKAYLNEDELESFYQFALYNKINLLLIESREAEIPLKYEKIRVIDRDLCEI